MRYFYLLMLLALMAVPAAAQEPDRPLRPVVSELIRPQQGPSSTWVGNVQAASEITLGFLVLGRLAERVVDVGDTVAAGSVLARLDATSLEADLRAAEAGEQIAEANFQAARDAHDRTTTLVARGVGSALNAEDAANALATARATLEQARAAAAQARDARGFAELRAPIDGVVTAVAVEPGATLSAGESVLTLAAAGAREVVIALTEEDSAGMALGARFDLRLLANPAIRSPARLTRIDPVTARATRTRSVHLALADDAPAGFRLGSLVTATPAGGRGAAMTLPLTALIGDSDPPEVWRVAPEDRRVTRVQVVTGPQGGGRIVVLSGLSDGDEIVVRGVNSIQDGAVVGPRIAPLGLPGVEE